MSCHVYSLGHSSISHRRLKMIAPPYYTGFNTISLERLAKGSWRADAEVCVSVCACVCRRLEPQRSKITYGPHGHNWLTARCHKSDGKMRLRRGENAAAPLPGLPGPGALGGNATPQEDAKVPLENRPREAIQHAKHGGLASRYPVRVRLVQPYVLDRESSMGQAWA